MFNNGLMIANSGTTPALFTEPTLDDREREILGEIATLKQSLRFQLQEPRRWSGALRRMTFARNIQGSNSIEGFDAELDDANAVAVSYTHLRAHETKANLVCRLLLEKKKTTR